jgi:serine/threonine-protein kinase
MVGAEVEALISTASRAVAPGAAPPRPAPRAARTTVVQKGWSATRYGLTVIGALTVAAVLLRAPLDRIFPRARARPGPPVAVEYPANSNRTLRTSAATSTTPAGQLGLSTSFELPGDGVTQEINANDGEWVISNGTLQALQAGNVATKELLRPRAYLSLRYFSTDDFSAEVQVTYRTVDDLYPVGRNVQRFAELSLRFSGGVVVSVFAVPATGVRLLWNYTPPGGEEVAGSSADDIDSLLDDEVPPPPEGIPFTVRLWLHKTKDGTLAEAFLNGNRVARELLVGLSNETGKVALGCRNLKCEFDDLKIVAKAVPRPAKKAARPEE